jgi:DNA-binding response OmpR family regulator
MRNLKTDRILVIDDDLSFLTPVRKFLNGLGITTDAAPNGAAGLAMLQDPTYTGVLLDLVLPDMNGIQVLKARPRRSLSVPVVVLTRAATVEAAVEAMKLGVMDFVEKPVRDDTLVALLNALIVRDSTATAGYAVKRSHPNSLERIADAVMKVVRSHTDVPTVTEWSAVAALSESGLYALAEIVGCHAKAALDFARLLRIVTLARGRAAEFETELNSADIRTVRRLLRRAGLGGIRYATTSDFISNQQLITDSRFLLAVTRAIQRAT